MNSSGQINEVGEGSRKTSSKLGNFYHSIYSSCHNGRICFCLPGYSVQLSYMEKPEADSRMKVEKKLLMVLSFADSHFLFRPQFSMLFSFISSALFFFEADFLGSHADKTLHPTLEQVPKDMGRRNSRNASSKIFTYIDKSKDSIEV